MCATAATLALDDPRRRFPAWIAATLVGGVCAWFVDVAAGPRPTPALVRAAWLAGLALRLAHLTATPAFSEDVHRYVYEGRASWLAGPAFPFRHAPREGPALLPPEAIDVSFLRLNHPDVPAIYPPASQAFFAAVTAVWPDGHDAARALRVGFVALEVAAIVVVARGLERAPLLWLLAPLPIGELAREGHHDALSLLGLALVVAGAARGRPARAYLGAALAALAKLNGLVVLPALVRETRRGLLAGGWPLLLLPLPFLAFASTGLESYATRWRAGDGAFALVDALAGLLLGGAPDVAWAHVGPWTWTRAGLARALLAGGLGLATLALVRRSARRGAAALDVHVAARAGALLTLVLALGPTLHPWYVTWLLPFVALPRAASGPWRAFAIALVVGAPVLEHPPWVELVDGAWRELRPLTLALHGAAALAALVAWRADLRAEATSDAPGIPDAPRPL